MFSMVTYHHWSYEALENMMPWELDTYVILMTNYLQEEENKQKKAASASGQKFDIM
jgi:hypothetical protein